MNAIVRHATARQCAFGLAVALNCGLATIACAEVHIEGSPAAVRVTTSQDTISDVLSAFAAAFKIKHRSSIPLDAAANANYTGSFGQVIARLLDGYNYVIKNEQETTEIVVFGRRGETAIPATAKVAPPKGIVSRWR